MSLVTKGGFEWTNLSARWQGLRCYKSRPSCWMARWFIEEDVRCESSPPPILPARLSSDVPQHLFCRRFAGPGFLLHLRSLMSTMNQKSSLRKSLNLSQAR